MIRLFQVALLLVSAIKFSSAIELRCAYGVDPDYGAYCDLNENQAILRESENETFTFTGLTETQRNQIRVLRFHNSKIAFTPKECLTTFPLLDLIWLNDLDLEVLTLEYMTDILKFIKPKITRLGFWRSSIKQIDPRLSTLFKTMTYIDMRTNNCANKQFANANDINQIDSALQVCYDNFKTYKATCTNLGDPQIEQLKKKITILETENANLKTELSNIPAETYQLKAKISQLKMENSEMKNTITSLEKDNAKLHKENEKLTEENHTCLLKDPSELLIDNTKLKCENDQTKKSCHTIAKTINQSLNDYESKNISCEVFVAKIETIDDIFSLNS